MSMNTLTRKQKAQLIDTLIAAHDAAHAQMDALKLALDPNPGCPLYTAVFELIDVAILAAASAIGDSAGEWLDWFVHDNDCGRKAYEAGYNDNLKPIRTVEDLLDLIEQGDE